jgi:hypothetical protein
MGHKPIEGSNPSLSAKGFTGCLGERRADAREGLFGVVEDEFVVKPEHLVVTPSKRPIAASIRRAAERDRRHRLQ